MNYKIVISIILSLSVMGCSQLFPKSFQPSQTIDRFQVQNEVAVDTRSDLMWSRCLLGTTWNGYACTGMTSVYNWQQAQNLVRTLNYASYNDWRLPTLEELKSLAETGGGVSRVKISALNQAVFPTPNCFGIEGSLSTTNPTCWEWTSTRIDGSDHYAWIVSFGNGYGSANDSLDSYAVRLVRNNR